ncbi:MAG TPA: MFS transporter [Gaiellales bacterium]|nr:MFS transporter [Gaiellales bacterium]
MRRLATTPRGVEQLTLAAMCVAQVMIMLDMTIVNVALPSIQSELDVPPTNLEWIVNAYTLALASLILVGGVLGDRYGRKRVFLIGLAIFTLGSLGCALAPDDPELIALRAMQGVGAAAMSPLTLSIVVAAFPAERRAGAIGIWAAVGSLGFGSGPVVGGFLVDRFDWSAVFWVNVPLGLLCGGLTLLAVGESRDPSARRLDGRGAAVAAATLLVLTLALIGTATHPWLSPRTLGLLAGAALGCVIFVRLEARAADPMVPLHLFHDRRLVAVVVTTICAYAALGIVLYMMTLFFQDVRGYSPFDAGLTVVPISLSFGVLAPFAGRAGKRFGTAPVIAAGCVAAAAAIGAIALTDQHTPYAAFLGPYLLLGAAFAAITPSVATVAMTAVAAAHSGLAAGIVNAARQLGAVLGIAAFGSAAVTVAERSWNHDAGRAADGLGQSVAGGQIDQVTARLGHHFEEVAANAFTSGMRAGLALAALGLVIGAASILGGARPKAAEPAADAPTAMPTSSSVGS